MKRGVIAEPNSFWHSVRSRAKFVPSLTEKSFEDNIFKITGKVSLHHVYVLK